MGMRYDRTWILINNKLYPWEMEALKWIKKKETKSKQKP